MTRATPQQRAYLENVYQNTDWPITRDTIEPLVNIVQLNASWIRRWFLQKRHRKDLITGITWFLPQQQQQQQQQPQPQPPPPQQPPVVAQIVGNWSALFPFMVAKEKIIKVFPLLEPSDGSLNLIYKEFRLTTPTFAKRKVNILRACKHVREGRWRLWRCLLNVINLKMNASPTATDLHLDVEHMGVSEINRGGIGFGAKVMLDLLERSCEKKRGRFSQTIVKVFELLQECERDLERALLLTSKDFQDEFEMENKLKELQDEIRDVESEFQRLKNIKEDLSERLVI
ncbi:START domain-containing protein [Tanacetum coccineum]